MYRIYDWKLSYSISLHGISLKALYRHAKTCCPVILLIKDGADNAFGAFISTHLRQSQSFYGTGETFLFSFKV